MLAEYCSKVLRCLLVQNWPEEQFPWQPVGRMVIDTPVSNFHNESEQIAFSPGSVVPGSHQTCCTQDHITQKAFTCTALYSERNFNSECAVEVVWRPQVQSSVDQVQG